MAQSSDAKSQNNRLQITNLKIVEKTALDGNLESYYKVMKKNNVEDPSSLLPQTPFHVVSFVLKNTYSALANTIRRTLMEEIPVKCLTFDEEDLKTDDEFIVSDALIKNVNLLPINQEIEDNYNISLYKYNDTNEIIDVTAEDITIVGKKGAAEDSDDEEQKTHKVIHSGNKKIRPVLKKTGGAEKKLLSDLIPDSNILLVHLYPNKKIEIKKMHIVEGMGKKSASKFSLLDNVSYDILDVTPYSMFTNTGDRSMTVDPKEFSISFQTSGNISPKKVMELVCGTLIERFTRVREKIEEFDKKHTDDTYYYAEGIVISKQENYSVYKIYNEYMPLASTIAQRCFILDKNIPYCVPTIDRYDNDVAIIKIEHAEKNKLLLNSIDECIVDFNHILKAFNSYKL